MSSPNGIYLAPITATLFALATLVGAGGCPSEDCESDADCFARETCLRGECVPEADDTGSNDGDSGDTGDAGSCEEGLTRCEGTCVDTSNNEAHCGSCGNSCSDGSACVGGVCAG